MGCAQCGPSEEAAVAKIAANSRLNVKVVKGCKWPPCWHSAGRRSRAAILARTTVEFES